MSENAKSIWTLLGACVAVLVSVAIASWLLYIGLDTATALYGVPETSYVDAWGLLLGVAGISWAWEFGKPRKSQGPTVHNHLYSKGDA